MGASAPTRSSPSSLCSRAVGSSSSPLPKATWGGTFVDAFESALPVVRCVDEDTAACLERFTKEAFPYLPVKIALLKCNIYKCVSHHRYWPEALVLKFQAFLMQREPKYVPSLTVRAGKAAKSGPGASKAAKPGQERGRAARRRGVASACSTSSSCATS